MESVASINQRRAFRKRSEIQSHTKRTYRDKSRYGGLGKGAGFSSYACIGNQMPKLLVFTACEKIVIDDKNNPSLIMLLNAVTVTPSAPTAKDIPKDAVGPKEWAIYASWEREEGDENKSYTQCLQILWPDGNEFQRHALPFEFTKRNQQNRVQMMGFPIGQLGLLTVNLWLESEGAKVTEVYSRTLEIMHGEA